MQEMNEYHMSELEISQGNRCQHRRSVVHPAGSGRLARRTRNAALADHLLTFDAITPAISRGEVHLARINGAEVGTFMLQWEDKDFWPDVPMGESAILHRLAVRPRRSRYRTCRRNNSLGTRQSKVIGKKIPTSGLRL